MALYTHGNKNMTTPSQTNITTSYTAAGHMLSLTSATAGGPRRGYIYEFDVGTDNVPNSTDCSIAWDMSRQSTLGTGVATVIVPLDPAEAASGMVGRGNYTIIPIITANSSVWSLAANQRASYRWVVNPGGPGELVVPATDVNGLVIRALSTTYASTAMVQMSFRE